MARLYIPQKRATAGLLLLGLWLCTAAVCWAQSVVVRQYTRANGLVSNYVMSMAQDSKGFIWIGTDQGVSRYDGRDFFSLTVEDGLNAPMVSVIHEDRKGNIWFGTYEGGVCRWDGEKITAYGLEQGLTINYPSLIAEMVDGTILVCGPQGTAGFRNNTWEFDTTRLALPYNNTLQMAEGRIIFSRNDQIFEVVPDSQRLFRLSPLSLRLPENSQFSKPLKLGTLYPGPRGQFLCQTNQGLVRIRIVGNQLLAGRVLDEAKDLTSAADGANGQVVVGTRFHGLRLLRSGKWHNFRAGAGFSSNYINKVLIDYEGNVWAGTFGEGLVRVAGEHLTYLTSREGLPGDNVTSLFVDSHHQIWAGTPGGFAVISKGNVVASVKAGAQEMHVRAIAEPRPGQILLGTFQNILGPVPIAQAMKGQLGKPEFFSYGVSDFAVSPNDDDILIGSYGNGLWRYSNLKEPWLTRASGLKSNIIEGLVTTRSGTWLMTAGEGVSLINNDGVVHLNRKNDFPATRVYSVLETNDGRKWFGTNLGLLEEKDGKYRVYDQRHGLDGNRVIAVFELPARGSNPAQIFAVSDRYLHRLNGSRLEKLGSFLLLPEQEMSINKALYDIRNNRLILGTTRGLVMLDLSRTLVNSVAPKVAILSVQSDSSRYTLARMSALERLAFDADQRNLTFRFAGLSFINESDVTFRFRLKGLEENWSQPTRLREIIYRNLPDGEFVFEVKAISPDGIASQQPASIRIFMAPPIWKTWWFVLLATVASLALVAVTVRYYTRRRLLGRIRDLEVQQRLQRERERISRDLHDHVGAQLSSMLYGLELAERMGIPEGNLKLAKHIHGLQQDARVTIGQLRETIWALHHESIRLADFGERVRRYAEKLLQPHENVQFELKLEADPDYTFTPTEALQLFRIAQEAINNAVKHSRAHKLYLVLRHDRGSRRLLVRIEDDGVGLPASQKLGEPTPTLSGYGFLNMRKRAEELGGKFMALTREEGGTCIEVSIATREVS